MWVREAPAQRAQLKEGHQPGQQRIQFKIKFKFDAVQLRPPCLPASYSLSTSFCSSCEPRYVSCSVAVQSATAEPVSMQSATAAPVSNRCTTKHTASMQSATAAPVSTQSAYSQQPGWEHAPLWGAEPSSASSLRQQNFGALIHFFVLAGSWLPISPVRPAILPSLSQSFGLACWLPCFAFLFFLLSALIPRSHRTHDEYESILASTPPSPCNLFPVFPWTFFSQPSTHPGCTS